jgi:putative ABC transport system permease protein
VRDALVTAEVALSLMLLVAAGLLLHSFSRLYDVQTGVRMDHTITFNTLLPAARYREAAQRSVRFAELSERLRNVAGVKSAGLVSCPPLTGACNVLFFYIEGRPFEAGRFLTAYERTTDPEYFTAAGIPLLRGRTFNREEGVGFDPQHPRTGKIVISESMAKTYFAGDDPIGKRIFFDFELQRERNEGIPTPRYEIVGVVGDVVPALADRIGPTLYRSLYDTPGIGTSVLLHTAVEPTAVMGAVREEMRRFDAAMPLYLVRTMDELLGRSTADRRFTMLLVASFAALAVVLAAIGLYGVVSHGVSQRTAEIGIRMALGATSADVNRLVVVQGLKPALAGVVLGLAAAAFASRVLQTLLFGVVPLDPLTFSLVPPLLLAIAALACYGPAARATRIDPTKALRTE